MCTISTQHKITKIPDNATNYLTLALCAHLQDLVATMITTSHHYTNTQFNCPAVLHPDAFPMWSIVVHSDIMKQLAALKKVKHEEEIKTCYKRKERQDMATTHAAALATQANSGATLSMDGYNNLEGGMKKKRKKEGPGVTAHNMSEDVRKKMSNAVTMQAMGLSRQYAWMNTSNAATAAMPTKTKIAALPMVSATLAAAVATSPNMGGNGVNNNACGFCSDQLLGMPVHVNKKVHHTDGHPGGGQ